MGGDCRAVDERVCGHDCRIDHGVRRRVADADADALQPVPVVAAWVQHGRLYNIVETGFDWLLHAYSWTLSQTIRFKAATMAVSGAAAGGDRISVHGRADGVHSERGHRAVERADRNDSGHRLRRAGGRHETGDADVRERPERGELHRQRREWQRAAEPGSEATKSANADRRPGHRGAQAQIGESAWCCVSTSRIRRRSGSAAGNRAATINTRLQDTDTAELYRVAPTFQAALSGVEGIQDISSDLQITTPQVAVDLDRDQIAALGLTVDQVETALNSAYGTRAGVADLRARRSSTW